MRQVPIDELHSNLNEELANAPFEVTCYGRVIAVVYPRCEGWEEDECSGNETNYQVTPWEQELIDRA